MIYIFYIFIVASALFLTSCGKKADKLDSISTNKTMNTPLTAKHSPEEFFRGDALEVASAIEAGNVVQLQTLIKACKTKLDAPGKDGMTLLFWAMTLGQLECVKVLLAAGCNPNAIIRMSGQSFQLLALAAGGKNDALFDILIASGANPNSLDNGDPAIFTAIHARRWDRMRKLLSHGADINLTGKDKSPPVVYLASINQYEQVFELISRGADIAKTEFGGGTLADYVGRYSLAPDSPNGQWHAKVKQTLLTKGIKVTTQKKKP